MIGIRLGLNKKKFEFNFMVLNNTICYVGKACKYGLVHAADESKVVGSRLGWLYCSPESRTLLVCSLNQSTKSLGK